MVIYKATNTINGKAYIGQTVRTVRERMLEHMRHDRSYFDRALKKYGAENFKVVVIDSARTVEELNEKEKFWIDFFHTLGERGYNMCEGGGNTTGYHHTDAAKQTMSQKKKTAYAGAGNPFYGKRHTEESCRKMSESRKGRIITPEWRKHLSEGSTIKVRVRNADTGEIFDSVQDAATKYKVAATHISRVCRGKRKTSGGYHWEYV